MFSNYDTPSHFRRMKPAPDLTATLLACMLVSMSTHIQALDFDASVQIISDEVLQIHEDKGLEILGLLQLGNAATAEHDIAEFSGLAWDEDENILYTVSDKGYLLHLRPVFDNQRLQEMLLLEVFELKNPAGKPLTGNFIDSEGLAAVNHDNGVRGDTELLVSFERIPRIDRYTTGGTYIDSVPIPGFLQRTDHYRTANTSLESVMHHEHYGILTAPEKLSGQYPENEFRLFSLTGTMWAFPNAGGKHGAITGMTATAGNRVLILERIFPNIFMGLRFALHLVDPGVRPAAHRLLVDIGPAEGYFNENFEAITHHRENRFFMISDNNNTALQRTLLLYFTLPGLNE